jgi:hypothetical protein
MKKSACVWCSKLVNVRDDFDQWKDKAVCGKGCRDAEELFCIHFSDVEMNRRSHYRFLTQGEDYD